MGYVIRKKRHIQATGNQKYRVIDEKPGGSEKVKAKGTSVKKAIYQRAMLTTLNQVSDIIKNKKDDEVLQYLDDLQKSNYQDRKPNTRNKDDIDEIEGEDIYIPKDKGGEERMQEVVKKAKELVKAIEDEEPRKEIEEMAEDLHDELFGEGNKPKPPKPKKKKIEDEYDHLFEDEHVEVNNKVKPPKQPTEEEKAKVIADMREAGIKVRGNIEKEIQDYKDMKPLTNDEIKWLRGNLQGLSRGNQVTKRQQARITAAEARAKHNNQKI